jgi:hypothetical protein
MDEEIISSRADKDGFERVFQMHGKNITWSALMELYQLQVVTKEEVREALGLPNAKA